MRCVIIFAVAEAVKVLFNYLDYPQCARDTSGWLQLHQCLTALDSDAQSLAGWVDDRRFWWPKIYFDVRHQFSLNIKVEIYEVAAIWAAGRASHFSSSFSLSGIRRH